MYRTRNVLGDIRARRTLGRKINTKSTKGMRLKKNGNENKKEDNGKANVLATCEGKKAQRVQGMSD